MDLYAENILDHSKHPHHYGALTDASITHTESNPSCGDTITLSLQIDDGLITNLAWTGDGCAISQAGMSILSDELIGKSLTESDALTEARIRELLGVPVGTRRLKCALLCLHTLKNALHSYRNEPSQTWHETIGNDKETR
jgi:nitrogen fixation protein NifU and related proteins